MFSLDDFESAVPKQILGRGLDYFENHSVESLEETEKGCWEAVVSGSEDYEVEIVLSGKKVKDWSCDCPYDGGAVCKHVVAVLYALREAAAKAPKTGKGGKQRVRKMNFEDILLQLNLEELRAFIRHQKGLDRDFGQQFMLFFSDKDPQMDVEEKYRELVRQLIKKNSDRGLMEYRGTFAFSKAMRPVLQAADQAIAKNNFREAAAIAQVVCLEVMGVIQQSDDSAGNIGGIIEEGIQIFQDIVENQAVAPEGVDQIFAWLEKQLLNKIWFDYGDFGYGMLDVAESIAERFDPERFLRLLDKIGESRSATGYHDEYIRNALKKNKIRFLQAIGRKKEAEQLVTANLDIVEVRFSLVEKAIAQKDFLGAKQLIAGGIEIAQNKMHPGTVRQWEEVLLRIAQLENDLATFRFFTKKFAFDRGLNPKFYQSWKSSFSPEEWPGVLEEYIQSAIQEETTKTRKYTWQRLDKDLFERLAPVYIVENQWERLLQLIPSDPGEKVLSIVHPYLAARYPKEMLAYYKKALELLSTPVGDRSQYQRLAELMKKVKQDIEGSHAAIDELAALLIQRYSRRPAMKEELEKVLKARG